MIKLVPTTQRIAKAYFIASGGSSPSFPRANPNHRIKAPNPNPQIHRGGNTNFIQKVEADEIVCFCMSFFLQLVRLRTVGPEFCHIIVADINQLKPGWVVLVSCFVIIVRPSSGPAFAGGKPSHWKS
jgi:hypothetical protein